MTHITAARDRSTSRYRWVPTAAGWIVGVIATLSLVASISPLVRTVIRVPREFVDDYIFNFPDTSFAWAFVLALLAAALAARKRIAWWILVGYFLGAAAWNVGELIDGEERWLQQVGELIGLGFHVAAVAFLLLARAEFWARVRRGALLAAALVLVAGMGVGTLLGWALLELFPGSLAHPDRFWYALNRVSAFAGADADSFTGEPHVLVNTALGLFGALALMTAAVVLFRSQRAVNALTGEDESAIRGLLEAYGKNDRWATSPLAGTRRSCSPPTDAPRSPIASRSACVWPAATRWAIRRRGPRPSMHGCSCANATDGHRGSWEPPQPGHRRSATPGSVRCSSVTKRSCTPTTSGSPDPTCGRSGRPSPGLDAPASTSGSVGTGR